MIHMLILLEMDYLHPFVFHCVLKHIRSYMLLYIQRVRWVTKQCSWLEDVTTGNAAVPLRIRKLVAHVDLWSERSSLRIGDLGMPKKRNDIDCLDRFYIILMTLTFGLAVPFLILTLVRNALGFGPLYLYSEMMPADSWPVKEYKAPVGKKRFGNYTPPLFLTDKATTNRVVEYYAVRSLKARSVPCFMVGSVCNGNRSHDLHSAMVSSLSTLQTKLYWPCQELHNNGHEIWRGN